MAFARQAAALVGGLLGALAVVAVALNIVCLHEFAHEATWWERRVYHQCRTPDVIAQTYGPVSVWCADSSLPTRRHEHMHAKVQPRRLGWGLVGYLRLTYEYTLESRRTGYWDNRFEVEARAAELTSARDLELPSP